MTSSLTSLYKNDNYPFTRRSFSFLVWMEDLYLVIKSKDRNWIIKLLNPNTLLKKIWCSLDGFPFLRVFYPLLCILIYRSSLLLSLPFSDLRSDNFIHSLCEKVFSKYNLKRSSETHTTPFSSLILNLPKGYPPILMDKSTLLRLLERRLRIGNSSRFFKYKSRE